YQDLMSNLFSVIYAFSIGVGLISLLGLHARLIARRRAGWGNSVVLIVAFLAMTVFGLLNEYAPTQGAEFDAVIGEVSVLNIRPGHLQMGHQRARLCALRSQRVAHGKQKVSQGQSEYGNRQQRQRQIVKQQQAQEECAAQTQREDFCAPRLTAQQVNRPCQDDFLRLGDSRCVRDGHRRVVWHDGPL
nr:hypothetical protein [Armatimonadota bacterium]